MSVILSAPIIFILCFVTAQEGPRTPMGEDRAAYRRGAGKTISHCVGPYHVHKSKSSIIEHRIVAKEIKYFSAYLYFVGNDSVMMA